MTTLRLGGAARSVEVAATDTELVDKVVDLAQVGDPWLLVGGGSNLVVSDDGFDGTVVRVANAWTRYDSEHHPLHREHRPYVTAGSGTVWDDLVAETVERGLGGLECLSGIPGMAGATPVQNVGAYGVEVADMLRGAEVVDPLRAVTSWTRPHDLGFGYRTSSLKRSGEGVVAAVSFWLTDDGLSAPITYRELATTLGVERGARVPVAAARAAVLALRRAKGMVLDAADHDTWSAGSFFTNPVVTDAGLSEVTARVAAELGDQTVVPTYPAEGGTKLSAGWLIENAGYGKGYPGAEAPVRLSTKHTLALTNRGHGTTAELLDLARDVRDGVARRFGVQLVPEPILVNCAL
ncbi:UDP-N-acetylmuramate dehydrogenase [Gordonia jinhuaensis]|uniref:UDP-N-acetylenolpyruvoylglucosamine reductase n=2 Tax=Gordonia jinhuaensis TaxID=1517702 RepID=A0A916WP21_9ACTN|nr:UDP-N-acetylenolpyruvoylglucosamine reductase [Gordonia jinhuaensis]